LGCCICCNGCTCMLKESIPNVSSVFRCMLQVCLSACCIYMLHMFTKVGQDIAHVGMTKYACWKPLFQVFQVFQTYVANVLSGCLKSRSWCCTCCNGYTCMFQAHVSSVSPILDVHCKCFSFGCFKSRSREKHMLMLVCVGHVPPWVTAHAWWWWRRRCYMHATA
jgi:hypothetical protein